MTASFVREVSLMIVGTPRSGTTLVQRLVSGLPGVRVPPETHFFSLFLPEHWKFLEFPLGEEAIRKAVSDYVRLPTSRGLDLDPETVCAALGGECHSVMSLFDAITSSLAPEAILLGEKTPSHLLWWRPLIRARPSLKFVVVVRDPRAVVSSNLRVPWGMNSAALIAEQWRFDVRIIGRLVHSIGAESVQLVRFESVVRDPAGFVEEAARFLKVTGSAGRPPSAPSLFLPWEHGWKEQSAKPVDPARADSWQSELDRSELAVVESICWKEMEGLGYVPIAPRRPRLYRDVMPRIKFTAARSRRLRAIGSMNLAEPGTEDRRRSQRRVSDVKGMHHEEK